MAVYKVPQDVEAEDKLIGPFTFRQFIFLIVAAIAMFLSFQLFRINPLLSLSTLPIVIVFGTLGIYRRPDQPAEIYLLAVLRFYLKPHRRIWDQEGIMETVHITAPKKVVQSYTDGLSQTEVKSRLNTLAQVMDSRGWSVKNVDITSPLGAAPVEQSDRLIMPTQQNEPSEMHASDDMLDVYNNPAARDVQQKMQASTARIREEALQQMQTAAMQPVDDTVTQQAQPPAASSTDDNDSGVAFNPYPSDMRQHVVKPLGDSGAMNQNRQPQAQPTTGNQATSGMTQPPSDDILRLANNSDLKVSTLANEAARIESLEDDQTISLH